MKNTYFKILIGALAILSSQTAFSAKIQDSKLIVGLPSGTSNTTIQVGTSSQGVIQYNYSLGKFQFSNNGGSTYQNFGAPTYVAPTVQFFTVAGTGATGTLSTSSACISSYTLTGTYAPTVGAGIIDSTHSSAITSGTYIVGIPGTCSSGQIQMSANAAIAETVDSLVFGSEPSITGTISTASVCVTSPSSTAGIVPGAPIVDITHPTAIASGVLVVALPGTCSSGQVQLSAVASISETADALIFGSVYHTPSTAPLDIEITAVGGGSGGDGSSSTGANNYGAGAPGTQTTFGTSLVVANGGTIGNTGRGPNPSAGGTASLGTGVIGFAIQGGYGGGGFTTNTTDGTTGGIGGVTPLGGSGGSPNANTAAANGMNAIPNSGSGGGGAAGGSSGESGNGGAPGGFARGIVSGTLASTYPVFIGLGGAGGAAGSGGATGGNGANGSILVQEKYQ
jgi:hypothetical protein